MRSVDEAPPPAQTSGETAPEPNPTDRTDHRLRRRGRVRRVLLPLAALVVGLLTGWLVLGGSTSVGAFRTAAGQDVYLAAYDEALAEGPPVAETLTLATDHGAVHLVRYDPADPAAADADPLVLLPGTQSGAPMWVDNIPSLSAERPVYVLDLLGQPGRSVQSRPIETHADDARWLAQVLEQLPGEPTVLGHSLGGWIAANLAVHEPDAAARVVLVDPVMTFGDLSLQAIVRTIPASVPWTPRSWREDFASWTANDAPTEDEPVADMIEAGMQHFALGAPAPTRFTEDELAGIEVPVLVIMAGASRMHDADAAAETAQELLPDATVLTYDGASHAVTGEEPDRIAQDVEDFLQD